MQLRFPISRDAVPMEPLRKRPWKTVAWHWPIGWRLRLNLAILFPSHMLLLAVALCNEYRNHCIGSLLTKQRVKVFRSIHWSSH